MPNLRNVILTVIVLAFAVMAYKGEIHDLFALALSATAVVGIVISEATRFLFRVADAPPNLEEARRKMLPLYKEHMDMVYPTYGCVLFDMFLDIVQVVSLLMFYPYTTVFLAIMHVSAWSTYQTIVRELKTSGV